MPEMVTCFVMHGIGKVDVVDGRWSPDLWKR
jgi:hypothetical protein